MIAPRSRVDREVSDQRKAAGVAKRKNAAEIARAPLLGWAGLVPQVTADDVIERKAAAATENFWRTMARREGDAITDARADWLRYVVWSIVPAEQYAAISGWADLAIGPVYCRLSRWMRARESVLAGGSGLPDAATIQPSPCWPELRLALLAGCEGAERERHAAAGCSRERCEVGRREAVVFRMTAAGFVADDGTEHREWEMAG